MLLLDRLREANAMGTYPQNRFEKAVPRIESEKPCPKCDGTGKYGRYGECYTCRGTGRIINYTRTQLAIATSDVHKLLDAFDAAKKRDIPSPRINLGRYTFNAASPRGKNPGAIYVKRTHDKEYMGKITNEAFFPAHACVANDIEQIAGVLADPFKAAIAYGQRVKACAICGRSLRRKESIDRGIGPICAENMGWFVEATDAERAEERRELSQIDFRQAKKLTDSLP